MTINKMKFEIAMAREAVTKTEISKRAGVSRGRLNVILNSKNVTPIVAGRIAMVLRMDDVELLDLAFGFVRGCYNQQIKKEQEAENNGEM